MRRGFTLIELAAVVGMIGVSIAMAAPAIGAAREEARKAACQGNVLKLGRAWQMLRKDLDGEWNRGGMTCDAEHWFPDATADLGGLGYLANLDVYLCPSLETPYPRKPKLVLGALRDGEEAGSVLGINEICYAADEDKIPKEPPENRAVLADNIELVSCYGLEPANHADERGRGVGVNVLFADMAVQWLDAYRPDIDWTLDKTGIRGPGGIGWTGTEEATYPSVQAGTWRRYGVFPNTRMLKPASMWSSYPQRGNGEDDRDNFRDLDMDDIFSVECTDEEFPDLPLYPGRDFETPFAFYNPARGGRCVEGIEGKKEKDCSLVSGYPRGWRRASLLGKYPDEYSGSEGWGWPDELLDNP